MPTVRIFLFHQKSWLAYGALSAVIAWLCFGDLRYHLLDSHDAEMFLDHERIAVDGAYFFSPAKLQASGRPFAEAVKYFVYAIYGNDPSAFHLVVVGFHTLASLLLAGFISALSRDLVLGRITGLLFLVNVTHFQAVHHISALDYPLALCCVIGALWTWFAAADRLIGQLAFYALLLLGVLAHLSALVIWPLALFLSWRRHGALLPAIYSLWPAGPLLGVAAWGILALTPQESSTWQSIGEYAAHSLADLASGIFAGLAWFVSRLFTTAHFLPIALYEQAFWEFWLGVVLIVLLFVLIRFGPAPLPWAGLWIFLNLLPFALLTEGTILGLPAGPSRYLYAASAGSSLIIAWLLVWIYHRVHRAACWGLVLLVVTSSFFGLQKVEAISFYTSGRSYIAAGDIENGLQQFRRAIAQSPTTIPLDETYFRLAFNLPFIGEDPYPVLLEGLALFPDHLHLLLGKAIMDMESGDEKRQQTGRQVFDLLIEADQGQKQSLNLTVNAAVLYHNLGYGYADQGDYQNALRAYRTARQLNPSRYQTLDLSSEHYVSEGIRLDGEEDYEAAAVAYRRALSLDPGNAIARINLGWHYYSAGQYGEAIAQYLQVQGRQYRSLVLFNLGLAHAALGETEKARSIYAGAIEEFGAEEGVRIGAVEDLVDLMRKGPSAAVARQILELYWPDRPIAKRDRRD